MINAFADTIKFLDLDLAAVFQTDCIVTIDLNRLSEWAAGWSASHVRFAEWARLVKADRKVRAAGRAWIASALASGELDPKNAEMELETAFAEACWKKAIAADPELAAFERDRHGELVAQFVEIEARSRAAAVRSVRARHQAAIPRGALGEMGYAAKSQFPPTSFSDRTIAEKVDSGDGEATTIQHGESAAPITGFESVLSLCEARGLESRVLRWHYPVAASVPDR